jgi:hypothetical protein
VAIWWRRGRPAPPRALVGATLAGVALFAVVGAFQARPYLKVADDFHTAKRSAAEVQRYSAPPKAFLAATPENRIWSGATAHVRNSLSSPNESSLFPGVAIVALAVAGVGAAAVYSRGLRMGLAIAVVVCAILSLGFGIFDGRLSYRLLFDYAPGWNGVRTPGRIVTLTSLGLALLAGAGAQRLVDAVRGRRLALAVAVALPLVVLAEGSWTLAKPVVPSAPSAQAGVPSPQIHLPADPSDDRLYQFWSVDGFPKIENGVSTFDIKAQDDVRGAMANFPDRRSVDVLRRLGIRTIVLHTNLRRVPLPKPFFAGRMPPHPRLAARKPVRGLGLTRRRGRGVVIYEIRGRR